MTEQGKETFFKVLGIAILGTILLIITNGMTVSGITIFDTAIISEFGWTKSELKFRELINMVVAALIMPFIGAIIDRYGVKKMMILGLLMIAGLYYYYSLVQTLWHVYTIHFLFAIAVSCAGTLATVIMVSQRIKKRRGLAIGIALAGTSAGGMVIPQIAGPLLEKFGWRATFQYEIFLPVLALILLAIFVKPVKYKIKQSEQKNINDEETGLFEITFKEALKLPVFWAISFAGFFCFYSILGIISNLFLYLTELGFTQSKAENTFSIFFAIILIAKLASGYVAEIINEHRLFKTQLSLMILGVIFMALNQETFIWPALIAVGLGWGGLYTLFNYIIITTFGIKSAGKIGGVISFFEAIGSGLGIWLTAFISDKTGSYSASFWTVVVFLVFTFLISFFIKPIKQSNELEMTD
ncbi:MFS transporter [Aquimarina sp. RZ0]|uniref:MFS transporter n=1 Tax=Aquimarina sp. RZ0 TaxID=2607730 RepID=UPI0011F35F64|nr:MFS transporter [Aquimarina sp. RZ0]KAA1244927.1 MFS transporter [Aquimarina sp. RZ0]